ncbi:hypothetical protein HHI36_007544 [Cryptolaemus montrouzieri]|uniref:Choline/carnitine acyltransferase domain-containing protein n=1 Tax=Cryptolaemus montrouzieri TaxID=559131 RepID=A0ABD2MQ21_9CUCU
MNFFKTKRYFFKYKTIRNEIFSRRYCECAAGGPLCHKSVTNRQNLPLLPIPKLAYTLQKLLRSSEPFCTRCELLEFQKICEKFGRCEGRELQQYLVDRAKTSHNWLNEWYQKCAYLCNRDSLPMNTSPVIVFPLEKFETRCHQMDFAARLILGVLKFRKLSQKNGLVLDTWGKFPLDMGIYRRVFSNYRVPKVGCDEIVHYQGTKHIIVIVRNNIFSLQVLNDDDKPLSYNQLMTRLEEIVQESHSKGTSFGILTSHKRDKWAGIYKHMYNLPDNEYLLQMIEKALFVVCIDDASPIKAYSEEERVLDACLNGFHGHGPNINGGNRWNDKTLQFFIGREGSSGIIFEHSTVDALPLGKLADFIVDYMGGKEWLQLPFIDMCERAIQLQFITSENIECAIEEASCHLQTKMDNFNCQVLHYDKYGKDFCKDHYMSPDAIIQIALQFAYLKTHDKFVPQQERGTTRKFYLGRNDIIRPCTCEAIHFLKGTSNPLYFLNEKFYALRYACEIHQQLAEDVMDGKGADCHLFGLMMAAKETGKHLPKLFQYSAYQKSSDFRIYASQNSLKRDCYMSYPPRCKGYGVCYNPRPDDVNICVTCRKNDCETHAKHFLENWSCSMKNISDIICGYEKRRKKLCE